MKAQTPRPTPAQHRPMWRPDTERSAEPEPAEVFGLFRGIEGQRDSGPDRQCTWCED
jgi:hypothetical protein